MELEGYDLVASLQALPESNPVEVDGIQLGDQTCQCSGTIIQTACAGVTCQ